jgi:hypothetical protein
LRTQQRSIVSEIARFRGVITDFSTPRNRQLTGSKKANIRQITDTIHGNNKHDAGPAHRKYADYNIHARLEALWPPNFGHHRQDFRTLTLTPVQLL